MTQEQSYRLFRPFTQAVNPVESSTAESPQNPLAGIKVLAVDDSPTNRILIKTILKNSGIEVTEADSGEAALNQAFKQHYDLVLLDIQMPGLDGYGTLSELRKRGFQEPIVALTAHAMKEDKDRTLAAGFADHLTLMLTSFSVSSWSDLLWPRAFRSNSILYHFVIVLL